MVADEEVWCKAGAKFRVITPQQCWYGLLEREREGRGMADPSDIIQEMALRAENTLQARLC